MIKGCAKRVVVVKDIESNLFEEAFFIVKPGSKSKKYAEEDFLNEAGKIVKHGLPSSEPSPAAQTCFGTPTGEISRSTGAVFAVTPRAGTAPQKRRKKSAARRDAFMFFCGFTLSAVLCTAIYFLRMLL